MSGKEWERVGTSGDEWGSRGEDLGWVEREVGKGSGDEWKGATVGKRGEA